MICHYNYPRMSIYRISYMQQLASYIYIYIYIYIMALMCLQSLSYVRASMVLTRADQLFIHNYMRSLLNIILRPILMIRTRLMCPYCMYVCRLSKLRHTGSYVYTIHIIYTILLIQAIINTSYLALYRQLCNLQTKYKINKCMIF